MTSDFLNIRFLFRTGVLLLMLSLNTALFSTHPSQHILLNTSFLQLHQRIHLNALHYQRARVRMLTCNPEIE